MVTGVAEGTVVVVHHGAVGGGGGHGDSVAVCVSNGDVESCSGVFGCSQGGGYRDGGRDVGTDDGCAAVGIDVDCTNGCNGCTNRHRSETQRLGDELGVGLAHAACASVVTAREEGEGRCTQHGDHSTIVQRQLNGVA